MVVIWARLFLCNIIGLLSLYSPWPYDPIFLFVETFGNGQDITYFDLFLDIEL